MHLQSFLSTCALALTANAALVPPAIDATDKEFWAASDPIMVASTKKSISLPCTSCPVAIGNVNGHPAEWKEGARTELQMEFVAEGKELKLNGQTFYPPTPETVSQALFVKQVYAADEAHTVGELFNGNIPISNGIDIHEKMEIASVRMDELKSGHNPVSKLPMRRISFEILGLADKVTRVDTVEILISESDENLMLFGVNTTPYTRHSSPASDACTTVLCRVRVAIATKLLEWRLAAASRLSALKSSCMRKLQSASAKLHLPAPLPHGFNGIKPHRRPGHNRLPLKGGVPKFSGDATLAPGGKNHPHGPYGGAKHHGHGGPQGWAHAHHRHHHGAKHAVKMIVRFFKHVMLPIFIGVAAGMAVSGVGMLVGQAVVMLWMRTRRNSGAYQSVGQSEESRESFEELPKYEEAEGYGEAPAYEEKKEGEEEQK